MVSSRARISVSVSFVVLSTLGAGFLFATWASRSLVVAESRSALFVVIMACVHVVGYFLYIQQKNFRPTHLFPHQNRFGISPQYAPALGRAIVLQACLGILTALILDGGRAFSFFGVALLAHWIGILLIIWRRPKTPTELDLSVIRIGILPIIFIECVIAPIVWSAIGESEWSVLERVWRR
jgi:hypothetical protein